MPPQEGSSELDVAFRLFQDALNASEAKGALVDPGISRASGRQEGFKHISLVLLLAYVPQVASNTV